MIIKHNNKGFRFEKKAEIDKRFGYCCVYFNLYSFQLQVSWESCNDCGKSFETLFLFTLQKGQMNSSLRLRPGLRWKSSWIYVWIKTYLKIDIQKRSGKLLVYEYLLKY